jgi:hypothetical protein
MILTFPNPTMFEEESVTDVELPNPQLGDTATAPNNAIRNRSMDGTQWITKKVQNYTARWDFKNVQRQDIIRFHNLLRLNRGEDIGISGFVGVTVIKILENVTSTDDSRGVWKIFPIPIGDDPVKCRADDAGSFSLNVEVIS